MVEIANVVSLINAIKNANSVKILILISYQDVSNITGR